VRVSREAAKRDFTVHNSVSQKSRGETKAPRERLQNLPCERYAIFCRRFQCFS